MDSGHLLAIILLPAAGSLLIVFIPGLSERLIRYIAAAATLVSLILAVVVTPFHTNIVFLTPHLVHLQTLTLHLCL